MADLFWSPEDIELVSVFEVDLPFQNIRVHSAKQIDMLMESIRQFGFVVPIVIDYKDIVVSGAGRLTAARNLGLEDGVRR